MGNLLKFASGLLLGLMVVTRPAFAQDTGWVIDQFKADITLNQDTSVNVTETLNVNFFDLQKHGIYRLIPVKYKTRFGHNLDIRFKLLSVTHPDGTDYPVSQSREGDNVKLKIGDPDTTLSGQQTYIISYSVNRVITQPQDNAEFYWNVTGNGWPVPITLASANVTAPPVSILDTICFVGYLGSTDTCTNLTATNLQPGEGLTIAVALDQSKFTFPALAQGLQWFLLDNWIYFLPIMTLLFMLRLYWTRGRDKQYRHFFSETEGVEPVPVFDKLNIIDVYGPPKDLSPGEVGLLIDEKVHLADVTATVIDLARRGYFTIKEVPQKSVFGKPDFDLFRTAKTETGLKDYERSVLDMLFGQDRKDSVRLSHPSAKAYQHLDQVHSQLYAAMTTAGYFAGNPKTIRSTYIVLGIVIAASSIITGPFFLELGIGAGGYLAQISSGVIILLFSLCMPSRTAKGRRTLSEIAGLREWIRLGAWREKIHEKLGFFEEVLPYAIAFGLTHRFIKAFADADIKKLSWYQGEHLSASHFSSSLNSFNYTVASGVSSTRPKSASSGGSGFSGGGSGGGFGGGGGGSW